MNPTVVKVNDGTVREQRFQSGDVVRRVKCVLVSGSWTMPCELGPPKEERSSTIPTGWYVLDPDCVVVNQYGAPIVARDATMCPLTRDWIKELEARVAENEKAKAK